MGSFHCIIFPCLSIQCTNNKTGVTIFRLWSSCNFNPNILFLRSSYQILNSEQISLYFVVFFNVVNPHLLPTPLSISLCTTKKRPIYPQCNLFGTEKKNKGWDNTLFVHICAKNTKKDEICWSFKNPFTPSLRKYFFQKQLQLVDLSARCYIRNWQTQTQIQIYRHKYKYSANTNTSYLVMARSFF